MSHEFTLSKKGRRLIKAFEGFRPVDRVLVSGQRIVGYGHKVRRPEAMVVSRAEANVLLKADLGPYEEMINTEVHAPLNQNQFDALVSLAFSIGPKAFLESPTLHLLNNGRPLDAARSFEIWRKSRIDGRTYIIDALVRRRAMEKALFLRPVTGIVTASRVSLPAVEDSDMRNRIWDEDLPVFETASDGYVSQVPFDQTDFTETTDEKKQIAVPSRRREDGPAGILTLSEVYDETASFDDGMNAVIDIDDIVPETSDLVSPSPIAVAAAEVSERLDALMEKTVETEIKQDEVDTNWPESLITPEAVTDAPDSAGLAPLEGVNDIAENIEVEAQAELEPEPEPEIKPDLMTREAPAVLYSETETEPYNPNLLHLDPVAEPRGLGPYFVMIVTGFTIVGASLGAIAKSGVMRLGGAMPFWPALGVILGTLILLFAFYYVLKAIFRRS